MRLTKSNQKIPHISSTPNLPPATKKHLHQHSNPHNTSITHPNPNNRSQEQILIQHRKQIESTLNQLHRLQSEIYQLNVPQNPHSSSPVKKQIKQLSYLYENMAKPKTRNSLNVKSMDIQLALRIMNKEWNPDVQLQPQIGSQQQKKRTLFANSNQIDLLGKTKTNQIVANNTISHKGSNLNTNFRATIRTQSNSTQNLNKPNVSNKQPTEKHYKIQKQKFQQKFQKITHCPLSLSFISKNQKNEQLSTKQLYQFLNYTECQNFDPIRKAYQMFLNEDGQFDLKVYNQINQILGLPKIKNINTFVAAIYQTQDIVQSNHPSYVHSLSNTSRQRPKQQDKKYEMPLLGRNATAITAKITFEQFKQILDLEI